MVATVFSALLESVLVFAGHGDSVTGRSVPTREPGAAPDDGGGIGTAPIVAVIVLALVTVGILWWLNQQEREPDGEVRLRLPKLRSLVPAGVIAAVIVVPLIVWSASSDSDEQSLIVERWTNDAGARELLVSLGDDDLNTLRTTDGRRTVRLRCLGRKGQTVLDAKQEWPFIEEPGYDKPHVHQKASPEQVQRADRCRVRGTRVSLEAEVKGSLTGP